VLIALHFFKALCYISAFGIAFIEMNACVMKHKIVFVVKTDVLYILNLIQ